MCKQKFNLCRPLKYFPTWPSLPASSGASAGSFLAPVVHDSAASDSVLPDRRGNHHPPSGESRPLPLPRLSAHPDPGFALGAQENDPEAHPALPPAPVWQGGQSTSRGGQPCVRAALSQRPPSHPGMMDTASSVGLSWETNFWAFSAKYTGRESFVLPYFFYFAFNFDSSQGVE